MNDPRTAAAFRDEVLERLEDAEPGNAGDHEIVVASFAQQRMWILDRLMPSGSAYIVTSTLRLRGPLDAGALSSALDTVIARHEALRTRFATIDGVPMQVIRARDSHPLPVEDLEPLGDAAEREARRAVELNARVAFDLARGPLVRARLLRVGPREHWLSLALHHIVTDGWSMQVLWHELTSVYSAQVRGTPVALAELPVQYADYALWQREPLQGEMLARELVYWRETLSGLPTLALPTDHPRPAVADFRGGRVRFAVSAELTEALRALGRRHRATLFMTLLAGFEVLLSRYSGQHDFGVGVPIAGRSRPELEGLIGLFVNTLVLRADLSGSPSTGEVLARVKARALDAYAHQDLPFEKLVEELAPRRELARNPLFQVAFTLQNVPQRPAAMADLVVERLPGDGSGTARFDLECSVTEGDDQLDCVLNYRGDLFERATVERMAGHWQRLLSAMAAKPDRPVERLPLLGDAELGQLRALGRGPRSGAVDGATLADLFEAQVACRPDAIAIGAPTESLTYAMLEQRANALAQRLRQAGVEPGCPVGVCLERSPALIVALVAIVKAGGAYVPLDPEYPQARLAWMLSDSTAAVLITNRSFAGRFTDRPVRVLRVDGESPAPTAERHASLVRTVTPDHLACLIYTSGSTGVPKGVAVRQKGILRLVRAPNYVSLTSRDVVAQLSSVSFDAATFEIWGALLNGGRLVLLDRDDAVSPKRLARAVAQHGITCLFVTTALLHRIAATQPDALRGADTVLFGGEACDPRLVATVVRASAPARFVHVYGPTEATTFATFHELRHVDPERPVPIGRPLCDTEVLVVDAQREPVPAGVIGELWIGGDGVAAGYWGRPDATAACFVADPFEAGAAARMYRTGDLARWNGDGALEFIGRADDQVKLRGFRIEPGEIAAALRAYPGVAACHLRLCRQAPGDMGLTAWVVPDAANGPITPAILRRHLAGRLPDYMIPASFAVVDALPLTVNGKVDVEALPEPSWDTGTAPSSTPRDEVDRLLCRLWSELLKRPLPGIDDDFFESGGHSLLAAMLLARVDDELGVAIPLSAMFEAPTIRALADRYHSSVDAAGAGLVAMNRGGTLAPIVAVPGVYGNAIGYVALARALGTRQPFYALHAVGLDGAEPPLATIEAMARRYFTMLRAAKLRGPYVFIGACFGATVAYELARQALDAGEEVALLGLLDPTLRGGDGGAEPPRPMPRIVARAIALRAFLSGRIRLYLDEMAGLGPGGRLRYVAAKARGLAAGAARGAPLRSARREMNAGAVYRANVAALDAYQRVPLPQKPGRAVIFETTKESAVDRGASIDWGALCGTEATHVEVPGHDSGDMLSARHSVALAERLRAELAAALLPNALIR